MSQLSATQELELSEAVAVYFRLLQVDRAWTTIALRPDLAREEVEVLDHIAGELGRLISASVDAAYTVRVAAEILQPPSEIGDQAGLSPDVVRTYGEIVELAGGVVPLAQLAYKALYAIADEERAQLDAQREAISGGEMPAGDLSRKFMCRFAMALMIAGGVTVWVPPHIHAGPSIAGGVSIATANRCWELEPFFAKLRPAD